ncbi:tumor necrosis factor receptor superfamily member 14-like isoform X1 [Pempheris klunzingeri]|uniref:tumor necrosis factor receptor superfamily member 14-like isoform X1 n=2 Tax=Pempheris klunzingeri TaxID=3127111 RepID=UPI00397FF3C6
MMSARKAAAAALLILMMTVIGGQTFTCHHSEYQIGDECCPMCPPGSRVKTDCTMFINRTCVPCTEGTFMNQPTGRTQCLTCTTSDAGSGLKIKTSCTRTSDTVCEPLEGFYCMDPTEDGCAAAQKHTSCLPGQYIRQNGTASEDTDCSDCTAGTFSDGTFTSCLQHTQCESLNLPLEKPGTVSMDAECGEQSSNMTGLVIAVVGVVGVVGAAGVLLFLRRKKGRKKKREKCKNGRDMEERGSLNEDTISDAVNPRQESVIREESFHMT